ncbi:hypothetical protein Q3G72_032500 [Acer saccharum]|nr:hypothetical protein Q3G72_032500 [Acer saccharum]
MSKGINKYVIIVYSDALSTFIFLISSLFIYSNLMLSMGLLRLVQVWCGDHNFNSGTVNGVRS